MEKTMKTIIYVSGFLCAIAFFSIRIPVLFNALVEDKIIPGHWEFVKYGEMYYFNFISHFKVDEFPKAEEKFRLSKKNSKIEDADILSFGDSFFDFARYENVPEKISNSLQAKVHHVNDDQPLKYLVNNGYKKQSRKKYLIFETVERNIARRFDYEHILPSSPEIEQEADVKEHVLNFFFPKEKENLYKQFVGRNYITRDCNEFVSTIRYDFFGYLSTISPIATMQNENDPFLFYHLEVNDEPSGFYYRHSNEEIELYCNNIGKLKDKLLTEFNLELIFIIIPNKYTIYHDMINADSYNELIPQVQDCLMAHNVKFVDLYEPFMKNKQLGLYHGTDTHWNEKGIQLGFDEIIKILNKKYPSVND